MPNFTSIAFNTLFNDDNVMEITYDHRWANGTGYFDQAVYDSSIVAPSKAIDVHGRRMLLLPVKEGNLIIFERYSDGKGPLIGQLLEMKPSGDKGITSKPMNDEVMAPATRLLRQSLVQMGYMLDQIEEVYA